MACSFSEQEVTIVASMSIVVHRRPRRGQPRQVPGPLPGRRPRGADGPQRPGRVAARRATSRETTGSEATGPKSSGCARSTAT